MILLANQSHKRATAAERVAAHGTGLAVVLIVPFYPQLRPYPASSGGTLPAQMQVVQASPPALQRSMSVACISALSGILACTAGLHPTASLWVNFLLVCSAAAAVTWAASTAPWWAVAVACGVAASVAPALWLVVALAGVALAAFAGAGRRNYRWARALAALGAVQVFARLEVHVFVGLSALIGCGTLAALFILGVRAQNVWVRQRVWFLLGVGGVMLVLGIGGLVIAGLAAKQPLTVGNRAARAGLTDLQHGDVPAAASEFAKAAQAFAEADHSLSSRWAQVSRFIPVAAHYQAAGAGVAGGAADVMRRASDALAHVNTESLRVVHGTIDVNALHDLQQPFTDLDAAINDFGTVLDRVTTQWLAAPLTRKFSELRTKLASQEHQLANANLALEAAPHLLGADGPRHYLVAFTTPAEARGLGGFMGNYAMVTIDHGAIHVDKVGRTDDLDNGGPAPDERRITGPQEFIDHWGGFGFVDPTDGTTGLVPWKNITMPPDLPTVAQVMSQLYPQSGGQQLDGVFVIDPKALATLMSFTGPVSVEQSPNPISADNVEQFILIDQYAMATGDQRVDLLDAIAHATLDRLLKTALPPPAELAKRFGPMAAGGHLMAWSASPDDEKLFTQLGMAGAFPQLQGGDGIAAVVDNAGGNKLDAYFDVAVDYAAVHDPVTGAAHSTATITLTNTAPGDGLPKYVYSNIFGLVKGTNRTLLSVYSALPLTQATVDGQPLSMGTETTFGWQAASAFLDVPPGGSRTVTVTFAGSLPPGPYRVVTRHQPMAIAQRYHTSVTGP